MGTFPDYLLTLAPTIRVANQGWGPGPSRWAFLYLPGGAAFRAPGRWALTFVLPLALLAAFGARTLGERFRGSRLVVVLLLVGVMVEYVDLPLPWSRLPDPPPVYRWLAEEPGDFAVLELPVGDGLSQAWYMFWAAEHRKRLVNGAIGFVPPTVEEIARASGPFDAHAFVATLQSIYPLRYLVVHRGWMRAREERHRWEGLRSASLPALPLVRSFGSDDVYAVAGTPAVGVDLRR